MDDIQGDFFWLQHGTSAAVIANEIETEYLY